MNMGFQDELNATYNANRKEPKEYILSEDRIEKAATQIIKTVKDTMLSDAKEGRICEEDVGFFSKKTEKYVKVKIPLYIGTLFVDTPYYNKCSNEWYTYDKKERRILYKRLYKKCVEIGITVELRYDTLYFSSKL